LSICTILLLIKKDKIARGCNVLLINSFGIIWAFKEIQSGAEFLKDCIYLQMNRAHRFILKRGKKQTYIFNKCKETRP